MLINLRNALMAGKRLPYDAEVEYVTNLSGRATITTDIYHNTANKVEFGVMLPPASGGQYLGTFRAYSNEQTATTRVIRNAANTGSILVNHGTIAGGGGTTMSVANADTVLWGWTKAGEANINGVSATLSQPAVQTLPVPFEFFYTQTAGRIYHFKVENQCDLIPVRKNGAGYLYDRMSGKMYGPDSGVLSYGPDVVPVEYIESHGTEWIDTGVLGRDGYDFEYRFRPIGSLPLGIGGEYEDGKSCYIGLVRSNGYLAYNYYTPDVIVQVQPLALGMDYNIKAHLYSGEQYFEVNGVRGGVGSRTGAFTSSYNLYLFAINSANKPTNLGVMRLYNLTAHLNTIPTRSFRPVRVGTEGAMMDVLTRRIYRNAGTGAFTYGNDLKYPIPAE